MIPFHVNCQFLVIEINGWFRLIFRNRSYLFFYLLKEIEMIEVSLFGIVLGLIPITLAGLFVTAYLQYRRGDQLDLWLNRISFFDWPPAGRRSNSGFNSTFLISYFNTTKKKITPCRIWTYDIGFWRPAFYRTELRALFLWQKIQP